MSKSIESVVRDNLIRHYAHEEVTPVLYGRLAPIMIMRKELAKKYLNQRNMGLSKEQAAEFKENALLVMQQCNNQIVILTQTSKI